MKQKPLTGCKMGHGELQQAFLVGVVKSRLHMLSLLPTLMFFSENAAECVKFIDDGATKEISWKTIYGSCLRFAYLNINGGYWLNILALCRWNRMNT